MMLELFKNNSIHFISPEQSWAEIEGFKNNFQQNHWYQENEANLIWVLLEHGSERLQIKPPQDDLPIKMESPQRTEGNIN